MPVCIIGRPRWWDLLRARVVTFLDTLRPKWREQLPRMRDSYGGEYPWAIVMSDGKRLPLMRLSRFSRDYGAAHLNHSASVSRFHDGSATVTVEKLRRRWPRWSKSDRLDFGQQSSWLGNQPDFPDMLRFIAEVADEAEFEAIATWIPTHVPHAVAVEMLGRRLREAPAGRGANTAGALGMIEDARAIDLLRGRLQALRDQRDYLKVSRGMNWIAYEACCCIEGLLRQCGAEEVRQAVDELAAHPMAEVRDAVERSQRWAKEGR